MTMPSPPPTTIFWKNSSAHEELLQRVLSASCRVFPFFKSFARAVYRSGYDFDISVFELKYPSVGINSHCFSLNDKISGEFQKRFSYLGELFCDVLKPSAK